MSRKLERPAAMPASPREALPIAPSMAPALASVQLPSPRATVDARSGIVVGLAIAIALVVGVVAQLLGGLIALVTNLAFHQRWATTEASPFGHQLGAGVIAVPVIGGLIVGAMARYGSKAIRGHGIP